MVPQTRLKKERNNQAVATSSVRSKIRSQSHEQSRLNRQKTLLRCGPLTVYTLAPVLRGGLHGSENCQQLLAECGSKRGL